MPLPTTNIERNRRMYALHRKASMGTLTEAERTEMSELDEWASVFYGFAPYSAGAGAGDDTGSKYSHEPTSSGADTQSDIDDSANMGPNTTFEDADWKSIGGALLGVATGNPMGVLSRALTGKSIWSNITDSFGWGDSEGLGDDGSLGGAAGLGGVDPGGGSFDGTGWSDDSYGDLGGSFDGGSSSDNSGYGSDYGGDYGGDWGGGDEGGGDDGGFGDGGGGEWRHGGYIRPDRDSTLEPVRTTAHEGEYVLRPEAVSAIGIPALDALNQMQRRPNRGLMHDRRLGRIRQGMM